MDSAQVVPKLSLLIQTIASLAGKAALNVRNCQTLATAVGQLSPLMCGVQQCKIPIVGGAITSFEGLERALSKAKVLIAKCGGECSRIYMVLRRERFVQKFEVAASEIESQANSLPLGALQLTDATQEQVLKCICELHEINFVVDGDEQLVLDTRAILKDLKDGVKLSHEKFEDLARKYHLTLNQDVLREAALLEKEREIVRAEKDKQEEELINQLLVLVTKMGDDLAEQKQAQVGFNGRPVPADFRCPLSLELMSDPVIVASGQTYERGCIQQWLDQGNTTCPKTRQTLNHTNLIPNYTVKALIASWCETNDVPFPEPIKLGSPLMGGAADSPVIPFRRTSSGLAERRFGDASILPILPPRQTSYTHYSDDTSPSPGHSTRVNEILRHFSHHSPRQLVNGDANGAYLSPPSRKGSFNGGESANLHSRNTSSSSVASSADDTLFSAAFDENSAEVVQQPREMPLQISNVQRRPLLSSYGASNHGSSALASLNRLTLSSSRRLRGSDLSFSSRNSISPLSPPSEAAENDMRVNILRSVTDLKSSSVDTQRSAATNLRLLAKHSMENRKLIANCGAILPLVTLLDSADSQTQENAVTALLNLSIDDNNKNEIAAAGAIDPLVKVLKGGNPEAKENSAATLFSLSVMDENKVAVGQSGAIPPLVDLLMNGSPRGKKDAATALFNLSILHENKTRIVGAGAIRPLVDLMADPAAGMVDKAVAVLANLATIPDGRTALGADGGIPALVEVVELGSQRGKENAAAALLHLCTNNHRFRAMVLQEGAIPPLVALSQSGTARAKEKALALLRHFREQRQAVLGRGV